MSGVLKDGLEVGGGGGGGGYTYRAKKTKGREKRENDGTIVGNAGRIYGRGRRNVAGRTTGYEKVGLGAKSRGFK